MPHLSASTQFGMNLARFYENDPECSVRFPLITLVSQCPQNPAANMRGLEGSRSRSRWFARTDSLDSRHFHHAHIVACFSPTNKVVPLVTGQVRRDDDFGTGRPKQHG